MIGKRGAARIADVAELAGVSTATVSRALASPDKVTEKTLALVMSAVRKSGYTPNVVARNLRTRKTHMVLVVVPKLSNPVFAEVLRGIDDTLSRSGYGMIIGSLDNLPEREPRYVELAFSGQVDGALVLSGRLPQSGRRTIRDAGLPVVSLCATIDGLPNVVVEDREAGRTAVETLVSLGHRRLGYAAGRTSAIVERERYQGFQEGVAAAGLDPAAIVRWDGIFSFESGVRSAEAYLAMGPERPTGVFASSDEIAIGFVKTVRSAGRRVPEDVSVIGFDGIEYADFVEPTLTTFRQPRRELGEIGARMLLEAMGGRPLAELEDVRLPVTLLLRESTGPACA